MINNSTDAASAYLLGTTWTITTYMHNIFSDESDQLELKRKRTEAWLLSKINLPTTIL
jgi:hypothetical protein